jgi:heme A synthase
MRLSLLFRVTGIVIFIQLALGGLVTFDFLGPIIHAATGVLVLALVVVVLAMAWRSKPAFPPLRGLSAGLVTLVAAQILLGLYDLRTDSQIVAWLHLVVALGIYGMAIAGSFMAMRFDHMRSQAPASAPPAQTA